MAPIVHEYLYDSHIWGLRRMAPIVHGYFEGDQVNPENEIVKVKDGSVDGFLDGES